MAKGQVTTDRQIAALPVAARPYEVRVGGSRGLYVRVFPSGTRKFELRYTTLSATRRRLSLGEWPDLTLAQARLRASENRLAVRDGADPVAALVSLKVEARTGETFTELAEAYWSAAARGLHGGRRRPKRESTIQTERAWWNNHIADALGSRRFRDLKRRDIRLFMRELTEKSGLAPASLASVGAVVQAILQYAVLEEKIEANPAQGQTRPLALTSRDRMFSDEALRIIWLELEHAANARPSRAWAGDAFNAIAPTTALALQLLILTLTRRSEVAGARWNEFDLRAGTWTIPAGRAKARHIHVIPLTSRMMDVLRAARTRHPTGAVVFPPTRGEADHIDPHLLTRAVSRICAKFELPAGSPHDFRRSGATTLIGRYGVTRMLAGLLLGHTAREGAWVTSIYDRHSYLPERHRALELWGDHLADLAETAAGAHQLALPMLDRA